MYPGLSEANCQVATFHYWQLVNEGQHQQFAVGARPVSAGICSAPTSLRQQIGALLVCAGQRLQGMQAGTRQSLGSVPTSERVAIA